MKKITTLMFALFGFNVSADTVEIIADRDNTLYETAMGDLSNGAGDYFFAGRSNQSVGLSIKRGLLHFDLSSIPAGATITNATLEITSNPGNGATTITLHNLITDWGEGPSVAPGQEGGGAAATTGDATWTMNFFNTSSWNNAGGDFDTMPVATAQVPVTPGTFSINSEELTAQVQAWTNDSANNFGLIVLGDETISATATQFNSRENSLNQPKLIIDYLPPIQFQTQLNPIKDNTLYETDTGSTSNGAGDRLFIGKTGNSAGLKLRRAVLEFDISDIHPAALVNSVSLQVNTTNSAPGGSAFTANLHLLLSEWGEGTSNSSGNGAPATSGDATWLHTFYDSTNWNTAGGDFSGTISSTAAFGTSSSEVVTFNSTVDMVADVQLWISDEGMNHGWIILGDEISDRNARGLSSREGNNPPVLTIDYAIPDLIFEDGFE